MPCGNLICRTKCERRKERARFVAGAGIGDDGQVATTTDSFSLHDAAFTTARWCVWILVLADGAPHRRYLQMPNDVSAR